MIFVQQDFSIWVETNPNCPRSFLLRKGDTADKTIFSAGLALAELQYNVFSIGN